VRLLHHIACLAEEHCTTQHAILLSDKAERARSETEIAARLVPELVLWRPKEENRHVIENVALSILIEPLEPLEPLAQPGRPVTRSAEVPRSRWCAHPSRRPHGLVFCRPDGAPLHPKRFSRTFSEQAAKAGLPPIRLHDLRHIWATLALTAGVHPRVAQERMGHSTVGITLGTYSHVAEGMQADAAALVAQLMTQPVSNPLAAGGRSDQD
jgi:hypothetical protein